MPSDIQLEQLQDTMSCAILVLDREMVVRYANHAAQAILEQSANQLLGTALQQIMLRSSIAIERLQQTLESGDGFSDSEVQLAFQDGRFILADVTVTPLSEPLEAHLLVEIKKIDQQKRISQESQQWAQQQAARDLIRGLAHEIKNPLGGIRGAAQLLERQLDSSEQQEFTQMIVEQSDRLRTLVDRLLGPNSPPAFAWHNIHQVLEKVRTLAALDESHSIEILRDYDPSIPDMWIDQDMLQQAVLNIVRNALQALDGMKKQGKIEIVTRIERQMTIHGQRVPLAAQVKIIDNGPGIPDELKDTLFYPMVTSKLDGTGLGLSIAQTLIDHHGGKVEVESWPGRTEFTLYIPITKKEQAA